MARKTIYEMSRENLKDMTVKELQNYIRSAASKIIKDKNSRFKAVSSSARYIAESLGERRMKDKETGHYVSKLKLGFKGLRKSDLLQRARMLQGHFKIDVYSKDAKNYYDKITDEALDAFETNTGVRLTKEELADFKVMVAGIKDIIEKFGSDNVAKLFDEVSDKQGKSGRMTLGSILREVYSISHGGSTRDLLDSAYTYIEMLYGEA